MLTAYWICLLGGLFFAVVTLLFGDLLDGALEGLDFDGFGEFLDPLSLVGGLAVFGGAGIVLTEATDLGTGLTAAVAAVIGLALALALHFVYVKPMKQSENSTGFSMQEYRGKLGEVITTIPARGYGEVLVRMGASNTFQAAASFEGEPIPRGTRVVVVEVRDGDLWVAPFEDEPAPPALEGPAPSRRLPAAS